VLLASCPRHELDGFVAVRAADIRSVRASRWQSFTRGVAERQGTWPPSAPDGLDLTTTRGLVRTVGVAAPLVSLSKEHRSTSSCRIGSPTSLGRRSVWLLEVDPDARWDPHATRFRYRDLTRIEFLGAYERDLRRAAGPRPAPTGSVVEAMLTAGGADPDLDHELSTALTLLNERTSGVAGQAALTARVDDDRGLVAGLSGWSWGPAAGISMVWVRPGARSAGWGGRLLAAAEQVARDRGCDRIFVSSFTFQAPGFYERHGYVEVTRVPDYPLDGVADVYLVKRL
jgi:ribosomal protein S18 acetylase RimI-like enzyme